MSTPTPPVKVKNRPPESVGKVERAELADKAIGLLRAGAQYQQIGRALGCSASTAHKLITRALRELPAANIEQLRLVESARLDDLQMSLWPNRSNPRVAAVLIGLFGRRARLLGLDLAPDAVVAQQALTVIIDSRLVPGPTSTPATVVDADEDTP